MHAERERRNVAEFQFPPFTFSIDVRVAIERNAETVSVLHTFHYSNGPQKVTDNGSTEFPASLFKDENSLRKFVALVNQIFSKFLPEALDGEAVLHLNDVIHFALNHLELDTIDLREQARAHARSTQKLVLNRLGLQKAGRAPQWQRLELARAVASVLRGMSKRERTYNRVAARLKEQYGDKAPKSGDALR